ncbi:MAG TPA: polysaccharide biosynthesis/export family protein, partial [bacterium]|nr:polysaccharide biosynthesis/export family protein [bacterium]
PSTLISSDQYVYTIGADDELEIDVWGYDNLKRTAVVRPDGMITYDMVGDVHCAGLTPTQLSVKLGQLLSKYLREPTVIVKVLQIRSQKVTVIGDIPKQGTIFLKGPTRLLDLLTECGYNPMQSKVKEVSITRKNGQVIRINLEELLATGNISQNIFIKNEDTIILPKSTIGKIIIDGEVSKPGEYEIEKNTRILISDAIRIAGGLTQSAVKKKAKIVRNSGKEIFINLESLEYAGEQTENYALYDGDRLVIPRVRRTKIYVYGESDRTGEVYLEDPAPHMAKLLAIAKDKYFSVLSNIKVIRDNPLSPGRPIVYNVDLKRLLYRNDQTQDIKLENNDVVFVPQSWVGSLAQFLDEVWPTVIKGAGALGEWQDIKEGRWEEFSSSGSSSGTTRTGNR